ncbi:MAG: hypothetical protein ABIF04_04475 [Chloroflexota bacterium]
METMIRMLMLGVGAAGLIGGPYILYLAFFKPGIFPKPKLAKWQGVIAFVVGVVVLIFLIKPWQ